MKYPINLKYTLVGLGIAATIGLILSAFTNLPIWASIIMVAVAMFLNGLLAEYEDNLPGGFNNPMSPEEIEAEKAKRRKRLLPWRVSFWVIFLIITISLVWILPN